MVSRYWAKASSSPEHRLDLLLQQLAPALGDVGQRRQPARFDPRPRRPLDLAQPARLARA
jgi:hypothetical protein